MGSLHPAIVHIPIGLLVTYSFVEIVMFFSPKYQSQMKMGKYVMLLVGLLGAALALQSGEALEHIRTTDHQLIETHAFFATATMWVYGVLFASFTLLLLEGVQKWKSMLAQSRVLQSLWNFLLRIAKFLTTPLPLLLLAVLGLVLISITGALGGAITHGPDVDPFVSFVYSLFVK